MQPCTPLPLTIYHIPNTPLCACRVLSHQAQQGAATKSKNNGTELGGGVLQYPSLQTKTEPADSRGNAGAATSGKGSPPAPKPTTAACSSTSHSPGGESAAARAAKTDAAKKDPNRVQPTTPTHIPNIGRPRNSTAWESKPASSKAKSNIISKSLIDAVNMVETLDIPEPRYEIKRGGEQQFHCMYSTSHVIPSRGLGFSK